MLRNQLALTEGLRDNQLALTEGLKDNQKAITQGFSQFERLADMRELPGVEAIKDEENEENEENEEDEEDEEDEAQVPIAKFNVEYFNRELNNKEAQDVLKKKGYDNLPSYYFDKDVSEITELINNVNSDLKDVGEDIKNTAKLVNEGGYNLAKARSKKPHPKTKNNIKNFNILSRYTTNLNYILLYKEQTGSGMFYNNPQELLKRFELLNGSLAAGNNGVLPEYIQIAHRLRDLGVVTNNQLNSLLRKVI